MRRCYLCLTKIHPRGKSLCKELKECKCKKMKLMRLGSKTENADAGGKKLRKISMVQFGCFLLLVLLILFPKLIIFKGI